MNAQEARRALWLAGGRAYYAHRRYLDLKRVHPAYRGGQGGLRVLRQAEEGRRKAS